ncbi:MAG UNVERIFIED_CONTAM: hypothetical protein LVR29_32880 [Microcystis novacekii LVE1205-3]
MATATIPAIPAKERVAFLVMMTPRKKTTALIDSTRFCVPAERLIADSDGTIFNCGGGFPICS